MLTKLASIIGVTGVSLLVSLQVGAKEALNPNPTVSQESSYNRVAKNQSQNTAGEAISSSANQTTSRSSTLIAQASGSLNPNPSILEECPYNRAACDRTTPPIPDTPPAEVPVTPPGEQPMKPSTPDEQASEQNIVDIAVSNGSFQVLVDALKSAGLVETEGPFTVFAPTDEAFGKLPQDAVKELLQPKNKEVLVKILRYHVVPNEVLSKDLQSGEVKSLDGTPISVKVDPTTGVMVNDARVTTPDVKASNGVIHIIDNVILPPDL